MQRGRNCHVVSGLLSQGERERRRKSKKFSHMIERRRRGGTTTKATATPNGERKRRGKIRVGRASVAVPPKLCVLLFHSLSLTLPPATASAFAAQKLSRPTQKSDTRSAWMKAYTKDPNRRNPPGDVKGEEGATTWVWRQ